jgi:hypothetical protein
MNGLPIDQISDSACAYWRQDMSPNSLQGLASNASLITSLVAVWVEVISRGITVTGIPRADSGVAKIGLACGLD